MIIPATYGNALAYLVNSSNQASGYINAQNGLSGSNIGSAIANSVYSNFDLSSQSRRAFAAGSMFVARFGLSRAAFPARSDWRWISFPT